MLAKTYYCLAYNIKTLNLKLRIIQVCKQVKDIQVTITKNRICGDWRMDRRLMGQNVI